MKGHYNTEGYEESAKQFSIYPRKKHDENFKKKINTIFKISEIKIKFTYLAICKVRTNSSWGSRSVSLLIRVYKKN